MAGFRDDGDSSSVMTVTELTRGIRNTLERDFGQVWVEGEISSYRPHSSGHHYFTLKDAGAQLSCVLFRRSAQSVRMEIANGVQVQASGEISVYEARGQYQLIVNFMQPAGVGALQAKFEALKRKLDAEGLFAQNHKKPIPKHPRTVALVTSGSGAAVRDILNVLQRRAPWLHVVVFPVRVQGDGADREIASAIRMLSGPLPLTFPKIDTLVVTRGGGSMEDLWNFNEESVARAIYECPIPVVSAVGHEIDFTISDFVADMRAPTPSAAAELIVPDGGELSDRLERGRDELNHLMVRVFRGHVEQLNSARQVLAAHEPRRVLENAAQSVDLARERLDDTMDRLFERAENQLENPRRILSQFRGEQLVEEARAQFDRATSELDVALDNQLVVSREKLNRLGEVLAALNPRAILERGYSVTYREDGSVLKSVKEVTPGDKIRTELSDGTIDSTVDE